jgi:hypothetical protein
MLQCRPGNQKVMSFSSEVYFELKLRFPADRRTVAIGSSDGFSDNKCRCAVGQRKTSRRCVLGNLLLHGSLVRGSVVGKPDVDSTNNVLMFVRLKGRC